MAQCNRSIDINRWDSPERAARKAEWEKKGLTWREQWDAEEAREKVEIAEIAAKMKAARPKDPMAGKEIGFGVADGQARYLIQSSRPRLVLVHLYVGDGYQVSRSEIRGLRVADVEARV